MSNRIEDLPLGFQRLCQKSARHRVAMLGESWKEAHAAIGQIAPTPTQPPKRVNISEPETAARLATCQACEHWKKCHSCGVGATMGCHHPDRTTKIIQPHLRFAALQCPAGKWAKQRRHLHYFLYPRRGTQIWQRNLDHLKARWHLFNGHKIITIATDSSTDSPDAVKAYLGDASCEFVIVPNDGNLREMATFLPNLGLLRPYDSPNDFTFLAHGKGVTKPFNEGITCHVWADVMYETCLDYWPLVEELFTRHPIVGSFKKVGHAFKNSRATWHYSGTFYWIRNSDAFARNWHHADKTWWGSESWPGLHYSPEEAGVIFHENTAANLNLYRMDYWKNVVLKEYERWKKTNAKYRSAVSTTR